jgi:hypothetical protein
MDHRGDGGLDLKYALTPRLTLTGTLNPDFGQVEVNPAVVNLMQFETFYPEKRPFFTEGVDIFRFGDTTAPSHFNFFFASPLSDASALSDRLTRGGPLVGTPGRTTLRPACPATCSVSGR